MAVERHAGRHDDAVEPGKIDLHRVAQFGLALHQGARFLPAVPGDDARAARHQGRDRGEARPGEAEDGIGLSRKSVGDDHPRHRSFKVARPASASTKAMIQNRITTVGSAHPICSKWWWIGAILNTRLPVRL